MAATLITTSGRSRTIILSGPWLGRFMEVKRQCNGKRGVCAISVTMMIRESFDSSCINAQPTEQKAPVIRTRMGMI